MFYTGDFIEMSKRNKEKDNSSRAAFMDLLYTLQDYVGNDFYNETVEKPEQVSKIYNTIEDLKAKFSDYEDTCDEEDKTQVADYYTEMYDVIDALKKFADTYEEKKDESEEKSEDYAKKVDEAFNKDPASTLEQAGLTD